MKVHALTFYRQDRTYQLVLAVEAGGHTVAEVPELGLRWERATEAEAVAAAINTLWRDHHARLLDRDALRRGHLH